MSKYWLGLLGITLFVSLDSCRKQAPSRSQTANQGRDTVTTRLSNPRPTSGSDSSQSTTASLVDPKGSVKAVDFRYLTAKSKISFKSQQQEINNTTANFRIAKDSLIWLSISGIGVEVVRALMTPDSVVVMDRLHRNYSVYSYAALSQQFNIPLSFQLMQSLLIGNLPFPQPAQRLPTANQQILLRQQVQNVRVDNFIGSQNQKLEKLQVVEPSTQNTLVLTYQDFNALNDALFPYTDLVNIRAKSTADGQFHETVLQIRHNKIELTEKNPGFPFSVPDKYERK